jgi:ABC-2 type transport system ATP-binding protein
MTSAIEASGLKITRQKIEILHGIDFTVQKGTLTGLIGPSGSGKTTLMRTIIGVQAIIDGTVSILGLPAGSKELRKKIGYVTQNPAVYTDLTVAQNLRYFATLVRADKKNIDQVITEVQLDKQRDQLAASLSGGQIARVSLAVALLGEPELLVLDEPTVGLDPLLRNELWELFRRLANQGKTLLVSSHVMDEAERCDNLMLLRDGKLLWNDTKEKLLQHSKRHSVGDAFVAVIKQGEVK